MHFFDFSNKNQKTKLPFVLFSLMRFNLIQHTIKGQHERTNISSYVNVRSKVLVLLCLQGIEGCLGYSMTYITTNVMSYITVRKVRAISAARAKFVTHQQEPGPVPIQRLVDVLKRYNHINMPNIRKGIKNEFGSAKSAAESRYSRMYWLPSDRPRRAQYPKNTEIFTIFEQIINVFCGENAHLSWSFGENTTLIYSVWTGR